MMNSTPPTASCPNHGHTLNRKICAKCRAAYMRSRRHSQPNVALVARAKDRAQTSSLPFSISPADVVVPTVCPALGIPLVTGQKRAATSPSLDRIQPVRGYVPGNIRVISDRANRLKGNMDLAAIKARAEASKGLKRETYVRLARYVDRELILSEVRAKAAQGGRAGEVWNEVACFLDRAFIRADWSR